jgi:GAF domain-containing protein
MFTSIFRYFEAPEDNDPVFIRLVRNILIFTFVATVVSVVVVATTSNTAGLAVTITTLIVIAILELLALFFTQRGNVLPAKAVVPVALVLAITIIAFNANSIHDISIIAYPLIIIVATLLQGRKSLAVTLPLVVGGILFLGIADMTGLSRTTLASRTGIDDILIAAVLLSSTAGILNLLIGRLGDAVAKAEENEQAQVKANEELKQLQASLEKQVQERTAELVARGSELEAAVAQVQRRASQFEALAQVSQSISSIRDPQELLPRVASLISEHYGFYHVGVFLVDDANEYAVLTATNSPGGQRMLERQHRLKVGEQGIVGSVAGSGEPRIALNVGADAVFFNNPDLPETHSEMALPLRSGGKVIGALDVQSTEVGAFTDEDVQTLSLLADQVSLAIENVRLFEESSRTLNELQMVMRQSTREAWKRLPKQQKLLGYRYNAMGASPLKEPLKLVETGKDAANAEGTEAGPFVVPIELRGEVIGNLVVQSPKGNKWNEDEQDIIRAVAERVALSAENARLFEETTQRAERERLVSEITGKIRSHNDPQAMIETALQELRNALGASRVDIVPKTNGGKDTRV